MNQPHPVNQPDPMTIPGEILVAEEAIENNPGRGIVTLRVENTGDRPVQVGSHLHLAESNAALAMDRGAVWGRRLAVPAGTSVRFEPGMATEVDTVAIGGERVVGGARGLAAGALDRAHDQTHGDQGGESA